MPFRHRACVADGVEIAEAALPSSKVVGDACRRAWGCDDARCLGEDPLPGLGVVVDALLVELVGVLADGEVEGALQPRELHVGLHLRPVRRLRDGRHIACFEDCSASRWPWQWFC